MDMFSRNFFPKNPAGKRIAGFPAAQPLLYFKEARHTGCAQGNCLPKKTKAAALLFIKMLVAGLPQIKIDSKSDLRGSRKREFSWKVTCGAPASKKSVGNRLAGLPQVRIRLKSDLRGSRNHEYDQKVRCGTSARKNPFKKWLAGLPQGKNPFKKCCPGGIAKNLRVIVSHIPEAFLFCDVNSIQK
ncbi:MAG: hypothetical protein LBH61_03620 [Dysgonamonadaceae bacterium]|jgi:hypothetical protein|nr:hypothetical protein [Dysgonamonadaceae bacterium]